MKRYIILLMTLCLLFAGCHADSQKSEMPPADPGSNSEKEPSPNDADSRLENLLLVDGAEEGSLLLADHSAENPAGIYITGVQDDTAVTIDGQDASSKDLKDGMILTVHHSGAIAESFPMQITEITRIEAKTVPKEEFPDLCGFYLKVLDDLWKEDTALNGETVGFDFSHLPGNLSAAAKTALAIRFGELHNVATVDGTIDSLKKDGYITEEGWKDGSLITIEPVNEAVATKNEGGILNFNASKWKSPLGALYWTDCAAGWEKDGAFPGYTIGGKGAS